MPPRIFLVSYGGDLMKFIKNYIEDIFIIGGLATIAATTFFISKIIGSYVFGTILFAIGVYFTKCPIKKE